MKTPRDLLHEWSGDTGGIEPRQSRADSIHTVDAPTCAPAHTPGACNGTETLAKIERALSRLTSGTYGICLSCGSDIDLERLDADPAVETCSACGDKVQFKAH